MRISLSYVSIYFKRVFKYIENTNCDEMWDVCCCPVHFALYIFISEHENPNITVSILQLLFKKKHKKVMLLVCLQKMCLFYFCGLMINVYWDISNVTFFFLFNMNFSLYFTSCHAFACLTSFQHASKVAMLKINCTHMWHFTFKDHLTCIKVCLCSFCGIVQLPVGRTSLQMMG